jgi:DNA adenine methylase
MTKSNISSLGHFSPLRYPGGKGKLSAFISALIKSNSLSDGLYVEPYAGGAAVAWELLLTGVMRRVHINDLNRPVWAFWNSVLNETDDLIKYILETPVDMNTWNKSRYIFNNNSNEENIDVAFAFFFLNRTNRSGILNGGVIGGKNQTGPWKLDARYNRLDLVARIEKIAALSTRIKLSQDDAVEFISQNKISWSKKTLVYLDPPYHDKGRDLYYNFYNHDDHANVAFATHSLSQISWVVSYDDVLPIHALYENDQCLQYTIRYSARERAAGREAMFFSPSLIVPNVRGSMIELARSPEKILSIV